MNSSKNKTAVFLLLVIFSVSSLASNPKLLFSVQVSDGHLMHVKDRQFILKIPFSQIESVLAFTDRPKRFVAQVSAIDYDNYAKKAGYHRQGLPNIVISFRKRGKQAIPFEIRSYQLKDQTVTCQLIALGGLSSFRQLEDYEGPMDIYVDD